MPGVACNALNSFQLVAGCDLHKTLPPPPPLPTPHVVVYCMGLAMPNTSKEAPTVKAGWGSALGRQHDLGIGLYHFAANALLPLVCAGAGNKAEFGVATVSLPTGRMAVALVPMVGINMQLDCDDPAPMPTSTCVASLNTVYAGFTLGDCLGGFAVMFIDSLWVFIVGEITGAIVAGAGAVIAGVLAEISGGAALLAAGLIAAANPTLMAYVAGIPQLILGYMIGTPLGYSFDFPPFGGTGENGNPVGWTGAGGTVNDAVTEFFSPTPALPASTL